MIAPARRIAFALTVSLAAFGVAVPLASVPSPAAAQAAFQDSPRYAAIVIDANTGEVLYARRADAQRYPASISKVMTLYLVYEALARGELRLDDTVVISPRAAAQPPSKLGLAAGDQISVDEAIRALTVRSSNDIAVALAEKVAGTEARFAALMTLRAQELGMTSSRFVNASGLPDSRQISTARDIAILSRAVMRDYPQYYAYFSQRHWAFRGRGLNNTNGLLHRMDGVDGIKTGYTNASGFNLTASAVRDGRRLIAVVLGGPTGRSRDDHVQELLEVGFDVIRRRERGEIITVAQSLFEQPRTPDAPIPYTELAQGDTSGTMRPIPDDALTLAAATPAQARPLSPPPPAKAAPAPARRRPPDAVWTIQVGAFKQRSDANRALQDVRRRFRNLVADAEATVNSGGGWHRAQYQGLTREAAQDACKALRAAKVPCMVVRN